MKKKRKERKTRKTKRCEHTNSSYPNSFTIFNILSIRSCTYDAIVFINFFFADTSRHRTAFVLLDLRCLSYHSHRVHCQVTIDEWWMRRANGILNTRHSNLVANKTRVILRNVESSSERKQKWVRARARAHIRAKEIKIEWNDTNKCQQQLSTVQLSLCLLPRLDSTNASKCN